MTSNTIRFVDRGLFTRKIFERASVCVISGWSFEIGGPLMRERPCAVHAAQREFETNPAARMLRHPDGSHSFTISSTNAEYTYRLR